MLVRISGSPGWPGAPCVVEAALQLLIFPRAALSKYWDCRHALPRSWIHKTLKKVYTMQWKFLHLFVWSEEELQESVLFFDHVGSRNKLKSLWARVEPRLFPSVLQVNNTLSTVFPTPVVWALVHGHLNYFPVLYFVNDLWICSYISFSLGPLWNELLQILLSCIFFFLSSSCVETTVFILYQAVWFSATWEIWHTGE